MHLLCFCTVVHSLRCTQPIPYVVVHSHVAISSCREAYPIAHEPCLLSLLPPPCYCAVLQKTPRAHCVHMPHAYFQLCKGVAWCFVLTCMQTITSRSRYGTMQQVPRKKHSNPYCRKSIQIGTAARSHDVLHIHNGRLIHPG